MDDGDDGGDDDEDDGGDDGGDDRDVVSFSVTRAMSHFVVRPFLRHYFFLRWIGFDVSIS